MGNGSMANSNYAFVPDCLRFLKKLGNGILFYYQLMHTTLKDAELLKHSKLDKNAPCFGLHRNHLQGAKVCAWLKITRLVTVSA